MRFFSKYFEEVICYDDQSDFYLQKDVKVKYKGQINSVVCYLYYCYVFVEVSEWLLFIAKRSFKLLY